MMVPLLIREREGAPPPREPARVIGAALLQAFSLRSTLVAAVLMLGATFASGMMVATGYELFIGRLGWTNEDFSAIGGGWGLVVGGGCAAITGFLTDKVGRRRVAAIAALGLAAGWIAAAALRDHWTEHWFVWVMGLYAEACLAIWSTSLIALSMDLAWPRIGGSQFSAYMALLNFGTTLGYQFSDRAMRWLSFRDVYLLAAGIQLVVMLLLWPIDPGETRRRLPLPEGTRPNRLAIGALFALLAFLIYMTARAILKAL